MSWEAEEAVVRHAKSKGTARFVLMLIARHADRQGRNAYPSLKRLSDQSGLSRDQVMRWVQYLQEQGDLQCSKRTGPGLCNVYSIPFVENPVHNLGGISEVVASTQPSNKEGTARVVALEPSGSGIQAAEVVASTPPKHTVKHPESLTVDGEDARARDKSFAPITKAHSARKPAHPSPEQPKEGAPTAGPPPQDDSEGLADGADIEALLADPVLLVAAGAWLSLQGRGLETLTAAECETLSRSRAAWGKRFSPDDIRLALDKTTLRKAQVPHVYFVGLLDEWAKQPANGHARARAAPNGHNGNGHAHVHGPEWNGVENGHIVDGAAYHAYHERLAEVRVVKSGGG